ncbi:inactive rhomboid protein 1 isoform X3 [Bactrocera dorsalis]|nr:inactive rhomboid protein 1 isoform X3 [Bactrocera dorsalis]XP_049315986.1 inactive rhomboid protein 1 isoform X3 [Bactrocera dorsalis]XP_049315987.1 inactive rhomboid protein 1 isoform X3 [Bactrocera dorsalis]XP_049315988.1 inactive rhomboid protein 1 isoform X3 [Bactrocera dorsalis]XP_049315989.1 inactive rhomboid protein 1 isoform X3 [Bactrocera dorsalis]XP_049315990.1 inactive rhomboid protein 1 isoform X3 [Bactrocera dorsalis]XP_049315991.1 inactive rhomboid protein 1 isoform X3 [Bact
MISSNPSNCIENDHHIHHRTHHTATAGSQTCGFSSGVRNNRRNMSNNNVCGVRCRSLLGYQPHLQLINDANIMGSNNCCDTGASGGRYSPHPNEMFLQHHGKHSSQPINGFDDSTNCCLPPPSPAPNSDRYIMGLTSLQGSQICGASSNVNCLDMHTTYTNYDGGGNIGGQVHQANTQHLHQHLHTHHTAQSLSSSASTLPLAVSSNCGTDLSEKYAGSMQQCSISPNTRFRLSDRYREVSTPKSLVLNSTSTTGSQGAFAPASGDVSTQHCSAARYASSAHFLTQNTPLVTSDTYTYLSSTVHTPVKRYVPTPPPSNELYTDISVQQSTLTPQTYVSKCTNNSVIGGNGTAQHVNTLPFRLRMKCCANDLAHPPVMQAANINTSHMTHSLEHRPLSITDYYATSPRTRSSFNVVNNSNIIANVMGNSKCAGVTAKDASIIILQDQQMPTNENLTSLSQLHNTSSCITSASTACSASTAVAGGSNPLCVRPSTASPLSIGANGMYVGGNSRLNTNGVARANNSNVISDSNNRIYTTPVTQKDANSSGNSVGDNSISNINSGPGGATTCLHCNTVRRTTGVHQTTQTTGPISPIPIQQVLEGNSAGVTGSYNGVFIQNKLEQTSLSLTPSTSESHISPQSPSANRAPNSRVPFRSKANDHSSNNGVEQLLQQQGDQMYVTPKALHHPMNVITEGTITEHVSITGNGQMCKQQQHQQALNLNRQLLQHSSMQMHHQPQQPSPIQQLPIPQQQQQIQRFSRKKRLSQYIRKEIARFFGVDASTEAEEFAVWQGRQRRLALRRFGALKSENELHTEMNNRNTSEVNNRINFYNGVGGGTNQQYHQDHYHSSERPDILPAHDTEGDDLTIEYTSRRRHFSYTDFQLGDHVERKASVGTMIMSSLTYIVQTLNKRHPRHNRQWSRSFAQAHINQINGIDNSGDIFEGLPAFHEEELFFDSSGTEQTLNNSNVIGLNSSNGAISGSLQQSNVMRPGDGSATVTNNNGVQLLEHHRQIYMSERMHGWRTSAVMGGSGKHGTPNTNVATNGEQITASILLQQATTTNINTGGQQSSNVCTTSISHQSNMTAIAGNNGTPLLPIIQPTNGTRGNRIAAQLLDGVLENSRRSIQRKVKLFTVNDLDDRADHRPFFTYWINTVQTLVLLLSLICYGIGPIGIGVEQKTGQVLVTSLSLQTVQHTEQRNLWIGPRNNDLVHMGAKFATCMRSDVRIMDVLLKTRRQERETACCIRNDDSGCVQSSQADCSVRGLFPTKSISTWKKWSPGESGPGGRISGSVCGLDPKYCDAPASIAPYEWPDDITKWPICRKTNSFSQRFRYKDHTAEHMVCEVIGHPCCTGVYGECRITTREYCDFVNGYFHEEASLCSQISCLSNVCGMVPFISGEVPDQFYRLFTSLCLHAGILHLAITVAFQHVFLADLERLIGPVRTAIVYIGSGLAGNLTSAVLVPYKAEVGPLASLSGVTASLAVLLILIHWKHLRKPHVALFKLMCITALVFGVGILPWQLNFAGLLAGIFCGIFLTIALVPFVSVTKYGRKSKINLIWSCVIFHLFIYSALLGIFYVFPTELTSLNVGEVLKTNLNANSGGGSNVADSVSVGHSGDMPAGISNGRGYNGKNKWYQSMQQQQYYYHHRSSDIITSGVDLQKKPLQVQQNEMGPVPSFYNYAYHMNRSNNQMSSKYKYNPNNNGNSNNSSFTNYYFANNIKSFLNSSNKSHHITGDSEILSENARPVAKVIEVEAGLSNRSTGNTNIIAYNIKKNKRTSEEVIGDGSNNIDIDVIVGDMTVGKVQSLQTFNAIVNQTPNYSSGRYSFGKQTNNLRFVGVSANGNYNRSNSLILENQQLQLQQLRLMLHSGRKQSHPNGNIKDTSFYNDRQKLDNIVDSLHNFDDIDIHRELMYIVEGDTDNKDDLEVSLVTKPHVNPDEKTQFTFHLNDTSVFAFINDRNVNTTSTNPKVARVAKSKVRLSTKPWQNFTGSQQQQLNLVSNVAAPFKRLYKKVAVTALTDTINMSGSATGDPASTATGPRSTTSSSMLGEADKLKTKTELMKRKVQQK